VFGELDWRGSLSNKSCTHLSCERYCSDSSLLANSNESYQDDSRSSKLPITRNSNVIMLFSVGTSPIEMYLLNFGQLHSDRRDTGSFIVYKSVLVNWSTLAATENLVVSSWVKVIQKTECDLDDRYNCFVSISKTTPYIPTTLKFV